MFRALHAAVPCSRVSMSSLRDVLECGSTQVLAAKAIWTAASLCDRYDIIVLEILRLQEQAQGVRWNCVLDDGERTRYEMAIAELFRLAPATMSRKIPRANVQQAFVMEAVKRLGQDCINQRTLCIGEFEDSACDSLRALGCEIEGIDPALNCDLDTFFHSPSRSRGGFDVIFSTSVIEHVDDDEQFLEQIRDLLVPGGVAILTLDFRDDWQVGDPKPIVDHRLS
jgi:SAM-dependent methyltransferase